MPLSKKKLLVAAKRRRQSHGSREAPKKKKKPVNEDISFEDDEEISSSSDEDKDELESIEETKEEETVEELRLRLAREYLESQKAQNENEEENDETLGRRLATEREAETSYIQVAQDLRLHHEKRMTRLKAHRGAVTCCCLAPQRVFSGSKDNSIYEHDAETGRLVREIVARWPMSWLEHGETLANRQAREAEVLALAASSDGRCLAAGGSDSLVHMWDLRSRHSQPICSLRGHRGRVAALAFQQHSRYTQEDDDSQWFSRLILFSAGDDAVIRHWQSGNFLEALYGHEAPVRALDCGATGPLSTGADRTVRSWKLRDETHLVYRPKISSGLNPLTSVDCCSLISDAAGHRTFLTGGDDGAISLWNAKRKKPVAYIPNAHGTGHPQASSPRWISALAAWPNSDLCFSGSCDGFLRPWRISDTADELIPLETIPIPGYINAISLPARSSTPAGDPPAFVAVAAAREHRLGRWGNTLKNAPNAVLIVPLGAAPAPDAD